MAISPVKGTDSDAAVATTTTAATAANTAAVAAASTTTTTTATATTPISHHSGDDAAYAGSSTYLLSSPSSASANTASSPGLLHLAEHSFTPLSMTNSDLGSTGDRRGRVTALGGAGCDSTSEAAMHAASTRDEALEIADSAPGTSSDPWGATVDAPTNEYDVALPKKTTSSSSAQPTPYSGRNQPPTTETLRVTNSPPEQEGRPSKALQDPPLHRSRPLRSSSLPLNTWSGKTRPTSHLVTGIGGAKNKDRSIAATLQNATEAAAPIYTAVSPTSPAAATGATTIVRPRPQPPQGSPRRTDTPNYVAEPVIVRRVSDASVAIQHPTPDLSPRTGAYLGNIAALEATAERFSMTSSIDDAIRHAHNELKRSDSQRSAILRSSRTGRARAASDAESVSGLTQLSSVLSRQNSIIGTNNAARLGGYSAAGYVMSPAHSLSNTPNRLRSGSKGSSLGMPSSASALPESPGHPAEVAAGGDFHFMSRHGPGKSSVRSVLSNKPTLEEIAELEPPTALTQDALDEADRVAAAGDDEDDNAIQANAHQHIDPSLELGGIGTETAGAPRPELHGEYWDSITPAPLRIHRPDSVHYGAQDRERPTTAASMATFDQALTAFGDFDGVHCDPDVLRNAEPAEPEPALPPEPVSRRASPPPGAARTRPKSYLDPKSGNQMLYYPAPVPSTLNLPPKLSRNPRGAAHRQTRSQVLDIMPEKPRQSKIWLPDPLEGLGDFVDVLEGGGDGRVADRAPPGGITQPELGPPKDHPDPTHSRNPSETGTVMSPVPREPDTNRQSRLMDGDKRMSRMPDLRNMPPQVRASVFFDSALETPKIEVKNGSATATLESILDASASAPVSAFTDHTFAGNLGAEMYRPERKLRKKAKEDQSTNHKRGDSSAANLGVAGPKKRASFLSLLVGGRRDAGEDNVRDHGPGSTSGHDERAASPDGSRTHDGDEGEDSAEDEDAEVIQGQPTTLLAELQLRKQQQRLRTRPVQNVHPDGLHSTLLELDTVAEVGRQARRGKKVNLAWEDPVANPDADEEDDEDIPLAVLQVLKTTAAANGGNMSSVDISAVLNEVHRPEGLLEIREREDNEPLSHRRERLQGRDPNAAMNLAVLRNRLSMMSPAPGGPGLRSQSRLSLPLQHGEAASEAEGEMGAGGETGPGEDVDPEIEGETLAERRRRLKTETLPRARPVSGTFSAELLSQFGGGDEDDSGAKDGPGSRVTAAGAGADVPEEEETLGQRRRRLQTEREAREREIRGGLLAAAGGAPGQPTGTALGMHAGLNASHSRIPSLVAGEVVEPRRLARPMSMSDILRAHPFEEPQGTVDPREQERRRLEAQAALDQRENDARMAALRAQMPQTLPGPAVGAPRGAFKGGRFNDGSGGYGQSIGLAHGPGAAHQKMPPYPAGGGTRHSARMSVPYGTSTAPKGISAPQPQGNKLDRVERWRQSVMP